MARIIVIDDQAAVRGAVRRALETAGHEVLEAGDGDVGLRLLAEHGADLVITDIFMPGPDGPAPGCGALWGGGESGEALRAGGTVGRRSRSPRGNQRLAPEAGLEPA